MKIEDRRDYEDFINEHVENSKKWFQVFKEQGGKEFDKWYLDEIKNKRFSQYTFRSSSSIDELLAKNEKMLINPLATDLAKRNKIDHRTHYLDLKKREMDGLLVWERTIRKK